jgi:hypothetical protein
MVDLSYDKRKMMVKKIIIQTIKEHEFSYSILAVQKKDFFIFLD